MYLTPFWCRHYTPPSPTSSDDELTVAPATLSETSTLSDQPKSLMEEMLLGLWEMCADQGLFRYDVTTCETKPIPGLYGFVAQLNEGRATKKRPTEFRVDQVGALRSHADNAWHRVSSISRCRCRHVRHRGWWNAVSPCIADLACAAASCRAQPRGMQGN